MNSHNFPNFDPIKKSTKKNIISFIGIPYWLCSIKKSAHAHNIFFCFCFWASLECRVDEIKNCKSEFLFFLISSPILPPITEFSILVGHPTEQFAFTPEYIVCMCLL